MIPQNIFAARLGLQPRSNLMPGGGVLPMPGRPTPVMPPATLPPSNVGPMPTGQPLRIPMNALQQRLAMLR